LATLQERHADLIFPLDIFKWHAAFSFISAALKDKLNAKKACWSEHSTLRKSKNRGSGFIRLSGLLVANIKLRFPNFGASMHNRLLVTDTQQQVAASRRSLRAGKRQR